MRRARRCFACLDLACGSHGKEPDTTTNVVDRGLHHPRNTVLRRTATLLPDLLILSLSHHSRGVCRRRRP